MKILFIGNTRLGDAILSTSILNHFKKSNVKITVVCSPVSADVYKIFSNVENIISVVKKKRSKHWLEIYLKLERCKWDLVIDLRNTIISRIIRKKKIYRIKINNNKHKVESLCKTIGLNSVLSPNIPVSKKIIKDALEVTRNKSLKSPILAIAPVTNWDRKNWPLEKFADLVNRLAKKKVKNNYHFRSVILLGNKNEKEKCELLKNRIKNIMVVNLAGELKIDILYSVLRNSKLFVGNDSGLMHLAAASGVLTLGLFGPSKTEHYKPWGKNAYFIRTKKSYDELVLSKDYNRNDNSNLMSELSVEDVYKKCISVLN